jgi:hypothetical protein
VRFNGWRISSLTQWGEAQGTQDGSKCSAWLPSFLTQWREAQGTQARSNAQPSFKLCSRRKSVFPSVTEPRFPGQWAQSAGLIVTSGLESREYGRRNPSRWPRGTLYPQKLALTSPTSGGRSVGIVRSRTKATEFTFSFDRHECAKSWGYETGHCASQKIAVILGWESGGEGVTGRNVGSQRLLTDEEEFLWLGHTMNIDQTQRHFD